MFIFVSIILYNILYVTPLNTNKVLQINEQITHVKTEQRNEHKIFKRQLNDSHKYDFTIVTAFSKNHSKSLIQFLKSLILHNDSFQCIIYDLGIDNEETDIVILDDIYNLHDNFFYRKFDYSKYPSYFNITKNAGEYAWKPAIIYEISQDIKYGKLIWCDAGNKVLNPLTNFLQNITYIYSPNSYGNISMYTHKSTLKWFDIHENDKILQKNNRNGAILIFNLDVDHVIKFINKFYECCKIKECIAPIGSSRENHRQDQSIFTLLFYLNEYIDHTDYGCSYIEIHCDIG